LDAHPRGVPWHHRISDSWGWRIPFLVSIGLVGVGLFIRLKIMESPTFQRVKDSGTEAPKPIVDVVKRYPRQLVTAMGMRVAENVYFPILTVFVLAYGEETLKLEKRTLLIGVMISAAIGLVVIVCATAGRRSSTS